MSFMCLRDFLSDLSLCACTPHPLPIGYWKDCCKYVYMVSVHVDSQHDTIKNR